MARTWFTKENTTMGPAMTDGDLSIINRAARMLVDDGWLPTASLLTDIRMTYKPGMSARDIAWQIKSKVS